CSWCCLDRFTMP
ncbi:phosphoribosyl transferase domain protein, partial [Vibrio parahaemolyticus AQ3810]